MRVQFKKRKNHQNTIRCVRDDGTEDWWSFKGRMDHDLAHFAVEKELGLRKGLYGHLNEGVTFKILALAGVTKAYPWHPEIFWSEAIVNTLSQAILMPDLQTDINAAIKAGCEKIGLQQLPPYLTDQQIDDLISKIKQLWSDWSRCDLGQSLEFDYIIKQ